MKILIKIIIILVLPYYGIGQKQIALEPSPVSFIIKNAGLTVKGSVSGLQGFVTIDSKNSDILKIEGTLDPNTIQTGITLRDKHLKNYDYFAVKEFPKISMSSTQIRKINTNQYIGNFDLTIKNNKRPVSIPFTFSKNGNSYALKGLFSINRLDFQLGEKSIILSDSVKIKIESRFGL